MTNKMLAILVHNKGNQTAKFRHFQLQNNSKHLTRLCPVIKAFQVLEPLYMFNRFIKAVKMIKDLIILYRIFIQGVMGPYMKNNSSLDTSNFGQGLLNNRSMVIRIVKT